MEHKTNSSGREQTRAAVSIDPLWLAFGAEVAA